MPKNYSVVGEDEDKYSVKGANGEMFSVAKQGLDDPTHNYIKSLFTPEKSYADIPTSAPKIETPDVFQKTPQQIGQDVYKGKLEQYKNEDVGWDPYARRPNAKITPTGQDAENSALQAGIEAKVRAENVQKADQVYADIAKQQEAQRLQEENQKRQSLGLPTLPGNNIVASAGPLSASQVNNAPQMQMPEGQPQVNPMQQQMAGMYGMMMPGLQGIQQLASAQGKISKDQATALQNDIAAQEARHQEYMKNYDAIQAKINDVSKQVQDQKIDPNRYWAQKGTGGRIAAAISLIMGGLGSAFTGQPNAALGIIRDQINQDIDAQKAELGKKENLLSQYYKQFGDLRQAEDAARLHAASVLQGQLKLAEAKQGGNVAAAQARMQIAQYMQPIAQNLAMMQANAKLLGAGTGEGGLPVTQEPVMMLSDPKYQATRVQIGDKVYKAASEKEAEELRHAESRIKPVMDMIQELDKIGPSALVPGSAEYQKAQALRGKLALELPGLSGINRLNETEIELGLDQLKNPTKFKDLMNGGVKNSTFVKHLLEGTDEARRTKLIGYKPQSVKYPGFSPAD